MTQTTEYRLDNLEKAILQLQSIVFDIRHNMFMEKFVPLAQLDSFSEMQSAEQPTSNRQVVGSSPTGDTNV